MDSATPTWEDEEWELYNDDGFVYKRKKRRLDPADVAARFQSATDVDPEEEAKRRREWKRSILLKLQGKYQREIDQWDSLSSTLRAMEEKVHQLQQQREREREREQEQTALLASPSPPAMGAESVSGSLVDDLLLQVEAQEAIIHDVSNLCDVAEAICNKKDEQFKQLFFDLPIWASPHELIASLCED
ncbi:putative Cryptic loci regulator protein 1 [Quillaja saponaria]|uniref:Cryptic loci regulator protein 1 n=1 Tax=Quillaja saponaria TaxID=32244 RepID=A0AAD7Q4E6_QUISA|nr:putative Cryptic loci regulator protein 1 [Quillaja saponaria]